MSRPRGASRVEILWSHVSRADTGCWPWTGCISPRGYGVFGSKRAHRAVYELVVEQIPAGLQLDHLCRNPLCVNPSHMEPVTPRENVLRGNTIAARNAAVTHCPQGHPYNEANTKLRNGWRVCKACKNEGDRQYRQRVGPRYLSEVCPVCGLSRTHLARHMKLMHTSRTHEKSEEGDDG